MSEPRRNPPEMQCFKLVRELGTRHSLTFRPIDAGFVFAEATWWTAGEGERHIVETGSTLELAAYRMYWRLDEEMKSKKGTEAA